MNSLWSCHVLWWFLRGIHPLWSQTVPSGKHTWPVLGRRMLEALRSPEGQRLCISSRGSWGVVYWPALGNGNFKGGEGFAQQLKGPFPTACKKHRCWTLTRPPTGFQFQSCVLLITWLCLVCPKPAPAPQTSTFL